jgi:hypothetical protein
MYILYGYRTNIEFSHRVQAIVEGFTYLLSGVEREKRWFEMNWAREEKEFRKIIGGTQGMYCDLQAVTGLTGLSFGYSTVSPIRRPRFAQPTRKPAFPLSCPWRSPRLLA